MRFISFSIKNTDSSDKVRFGLLNSDKSGVIELTDRIAALDIGVNDLQDLVESSQLAAADQFKDLPADYSLDEIRFESLLRWPRKIFCIGVNYGGRSAEYADKADAAYPSVFVRFPDSFTAHEKPLIRPPESPQLDYEGEIVVVIGKAGRRIPMESAREHIAGLTLGNEGTIRDWVRHAKFNVTQGKNWENTGAIGPALVTIDEIGDFEKLHLTTRVNGELRQDDLPATMKYSIEYQVHYLSTFATLQPGDVIFSGTPTGAGARFDPPIWLKPGDVIEVNVPELGTLSNPISDEFEAGSEGASLQPPAPQ